MLKRHGILILALLYLLVFQNQLFADNLEQRLHDRIIPPELIRHNAMALVIDPETGAILDANETATEFYGYGTRGLLTMRIQEINALSPEDIRAERMRAREEQRNYFIFPHRLANGEMKTVEVYSSPFVETSHGTLLLSIIHDATEKALVEEELLEYKTRLEQLVIRRTQEAMTAHNRSKWLTIFGLLVVFALVLVIFQRNQRAKHFRKQLEIEQERKVLLERFEYLTRYANDIILLIDENGEIIEANERAAVAYGYPREELVHRNIKDFRVPEERKLYENDRNKASIEKGSVYETWHLRRDGTRFPVESSVASHQVNGQNFYQHIIRDITDRKRAEELDRIRLSLLEFAATHSLEELLQKVLDEVGALIDSPIGFYHFVEEDQKTVSLQAWSTLTVKEFCKAEGKGVHYGLDQAGVWVDCVREKRPVIHNDYNSLPHRKGFPDGHAPVIRELVVPVMRGGNIVAILGIGNKPVDYTDKDLELVSYLADLAWEITNRKRMEEALRESEERYRFLVDHSYDLIWMLKADGVFIYVSPSWKAMLGYEPSYMVGKAFQPFVHPDDVAKCESYMSRVLEAEKALSGPQYRVRHAEGTWRWHTGSVTPVYSEDGSFMYFVGISRDITEQVELEQRRQQIVKLESLNRMAGAVAHHFNNMLSIVIGNLELALTESARGAMGGEDPADYLNKAMEGARRAAEMSAFILAYTGRLTQRMEVHDLSKVCKGIVAGLRETMPNGIRVVTDSSAAFELPARVAPDLLRQALSHLLANAREAMEDEEGEIHVSVTTVKGMDISTTAIWPPDWKPGEEEYAAIQVKDTGCGISAEDLGKVMDPFFSTKFTGRGIGLSIVLGIAQAHQGAVTVESEIGVGSTFQVLFPLADQKTTSSRETVIEPAVSMEEGGRILLVEDEEMVRNMLGRMRFAW